MKLLLALLLSVFFAVAAAQTNETPEEEIPKTIITVKEEKRKMSQGYHDGLTVFIPEAQKRNVEQALVKYMKNYEAKSDEKRGEYFYDDAQIKQFGTSPVDVYSVVIQQEKGVSVELYFDLGGSYLNSKNHPDWFDIASRMLHDFARDQAVEALEDRITVSEKALAVAVQDQENLVRQDSTLTRRIRDCQETIRESEEAIKLNREKQTLGLSNISGQQKHIETLKARQAGIE